MSFTILGKWRNAISLTEDDETHEIKMWRFNKNLPNDKKPGEMGRWQQITYFTTPEDFEDFVDFLDEISEARDGDDKPAEEE